MKNIVDKTVETCRAALVQVLCDAKKHAATAEGTNLDSTADWKELVPTSRRPTPTWPAPDRKENR